MPRPRRSARLLLLVCVFFALIFPAAAARAAPVPATATTRPVFQVNFAHPTADKPQSKLWFAHGRWWALLPRATAPSLWERTGAGWREHGEIAAALRGVPGRADVWSDADGATAVGVGPGSLAVFRVRATDSGATSWEARSLATLPVDVDPATPLETATIVRDGAKHWWIATTARQRVLVWHSADGVAWEGPHPLETGIGADDICTLMSLPDGVGIVWSDQARDRIAFRLHRDGRAPTDWEEIEIVASGGNTADDHLNTALLADGTLVVVTKNSLDTLGEPQLVLRVRSGLSWRNLPYAPLREGAEPSRPIVIAAPDSRSLVSAHTVYNNRQRPRLHDHIVAGRLDLTSPDVLREVKPAITPELELGSQVNDATGPKSAFPDNAPWLLLASDRQGRIYEVDLRALGLAR
jgi:hypothetical protein